MVYQNLIIMAILVTGISCASPYLDPKQKVEVDKIITSSDSIPTQWIKYKTTAIKAESSNLIYSLQEPKIGIPFKMRSKEWADFKSKLCEGCTLWYWESPKYGKPEFYEQFHGYAIKRGDTVIALFKNGWTLSYLDL
jgi:hypothetical protein